MARMSEKRLYIGRLLTEQRNSSKNRKHPMPLYSIEELWEWVNNEENKVVFDLLWDKWKESGNRWDKPSIDRLDDFKPYSLDNIQLMSWLDNNKKSHEMARLGKTVNSSVKEIDVYDSTTLDKLDTVFSLTEASKIYNVSPGTISVQCSKDKVDANYVGNYIFRYKGDPLPKIYKGIPVSQYTKDGEFIQTFKCVKDAMSYLGMPNNDPSPLRAVVKGRKKSYKGYIWK